MSESQWVLLLVGGAGLAGVGLVLTVLMQHRLPERARRARRAWESDEIADAPLRIVRHSLIQQQDIFRGLMLRARQEYLQLVNSGLESHRLKEVDTRTQLTLLQLEELEGDFARTMELKKRAEAEILKLAQEAARDKPRLEKPAEINFDQSQS